MRRSEGLIPLIRLNGADRPLYEQLYDELRKAILADHLPRGTRLPSTRSLASDLDVSRTTVIEAYRQLEAEGYVEATVGSGTFVAEDLPEASLRTRAATQALPTGGLFPEDRRLSARGRRLFLLGSEIRWESDLKPFSPFIPALDAFPTRTWQSVESTVPLDGPELLPADPAGEPALRAAIASHVSATRGGTCRPEQVVVMSMLQEGYSILADLLLDPGDRILFEDPGYPRARRAFENAGEIVPVPVDRDGMKVLEGFERAPSARVAYLTPSHQVPLGATLSEGRRSELLSWAYRTGGWIIEDDYDGEYRYEGRPLPSIWSMDRTQECVVYAKTFRKVLFPSLHLAFMLLPERLVEPFVAARQLRVGPPPNVRAQRTLATFIEEGHFDRHIRQMRKVYATRRTYLREALDEALADRIELSEPDAGSHLIVWLPEGVSDVEMSRRAASRGVEAPALSSFARLPLRRGGLVLGYGAFPPAVLQRAVTELAGAFADEA